MNATLPKTRWQEIKDMWTHEYTALWVLPGVLLGLCIGFVLGWLAQDGISAVGAVTFITGYLPDILTIGLTVTILYYFDQWRSDKREEKRLKEELLWQVKSRSNDVAISALDRLRVNNWLDLLKGQDLSNVQWQRANLRACQLVKANLVGSNLHNAEMRLVNLSHSTLSLSDFSDAKMFEADLSHSLMRDAVFDRADMVSAKLNNVDMHEVSFIGTQLWYANLREATIALSDLRNSVLIWADLQGAYLVSTNFHNSDLMDANLAFANLQGAQFNRQTRLPDGTYWTPDTDMTRFTDPNHTRFWRSDGGWSPAY